MNTIKKNTTKMNTIKMNTIKINTPNKDTNKTLMNKYQNQNRTVGGPTQNSNRGNSQLNTTTEQVTPKRPLLTAPRIRTCTTNTNKNRINHKQPVKKQSNNTEHKQKQNDNKINIMTINVRGIKSKMDSLETALHAMNIDIAAITETHLKNNEGIKIQGYIWNGKNRKGDGGGIGFLYREKISSKIIDIEHNSEKEIKWIQLKAKKCEHRCLLWTARECQQRRSEKGI